MYQGLLAVAKIPEPPTLEQLLATAPRPRLILAADGLSNAENIGALIRNCAAFNGTALLTGKTCSSPYLRRAVRASMGTIFELTVLEQVDLVSALRLMKELITAGAMP